jgi:EAL domain-containing protein (putative c-di-GMP-specific phosphodiesterase class I)
VPRYDSAEEVLRDADTAMYRAKAEGRGRHQVFDPSMHERALLALRLESDLRRGLDRGEFVLHYQPIMAMARGRISGFEALLRWNHPERGLVPPDEFIPIAEETGLIVPLGRWALREACRQVREWVASGAQRLSMAVNVSGRQFGLRELPREVSDALGDASLEPACLHLEITENSIVADTDHAREVVAGLKEIGVQLHVDDFGVGYSSLSSLHRFPLDALKIDRSFVARMSDGELEVVRTVTLLAQSLEMEVVAEGVETPEQLAQLRALRCTYAQGFLFSKPLPPEQAVELLATAPRW